METNLDLTPTQMKRLITGGAVMISPQMVGGAVSCTLHPMKHKKMMKNHAAGKKYRLQMDESELTGGSWKSLKRGLKKGFKAVGKISKVAGKDLGEALKTGAKQGWELYKKDVKPIVGPPIRNAMKKGIHTAIEGTTGFFTENPIAVGLAHKVANELEKYVDMLGDKSQAFGMKRPCCHSCGRPRLMA